MPSCSPEEIKELSELLARGKYGETEGISIDNPIKPTQDPAVNETNRKVGWFSNWRPQRAAHGDEFGVNAIDPLTQVDIKGNNIKAKYLAALKEALAPLGDTKLARLWGGIGTSAETRQQVFKALQKVDRGGVYIGAEGEFAPDIIKAAQAVRTKFYDPLHDAYFINPDQYIRGYAPSVAKRTSGIMRLEDAELSGPESIFRKQLKAQDIVFYNELERKGLVLNPDEDVVNTAVNYLNGLVRAKVLRPEIERLEKGFVNNFFGLKIYRSPAGMSYTVANDAVGYSNWHELVHHVLGGPTPGDITATMNLKFLANKMGYDVDTRGLYQVSQALTSLQYSGAMGLRPASVIRQMTQIVPTYAMLGAKHTMAGIQAAMQPGAVQGLIERNLLSSPLDNLIEAVDVGRGVGRVISNISETTLKAIGAVDRFTRAATLFGAESKFNEYHALGQIEKLSIRKDLKDEVMRLYNAGNIEAAKERYMFSTTADLQYSFGRTNRPANFRGAVNGLVGMFMSYPLNTVEMVRMMGQQGKEGDWMPLARLMVTTSALMTVGSQMLNADLTSATILGMFPHSMAFPKTALDAYQVGNSNVSWLTGHLFGVGETDFAAHQRNDNNNAFLRDLKAYIPGGLLFLNDIPRAIDEGSLARMLALTPKAAQANEYARERARESSMERGMTLRPLAP